MNNHKVVPNRHYEPFHRKFPDKIPKGGMLHTGYETPTLPTGDMWADEDSHLAEIIHSTD